MKNLNVIVCLAVVLLAGTLLAQPKAPAPLSSVSLIPIGFQQWNQKLASYRGEIVVVDMWATWCAPCLERFPRMVGLHKKYGGKGVRFVSMSLDDRDDQGALQRARDFLVKQRATFENYRMNENVTDAFEKLDLLGIPAVLIYDRGGKLMHKLTGDNPYRQFTDADVEKAIEISLGNTIQRQH